MVVAVHDKSQKQLSADPQASISNLGSGLDRVGFTLTPMLTSHLRVTSPNPFLTTHLYYRLGTPSRSRAVPKRTADPEMCNALRTCVKDSFLELPGVTCRCPLPFHHLESAVPPMLDKAFRSLSHKSCALPTPSYRSTVWCARNHFPHNATRKAGLVYNPSQLVHTLTAKARIPCGIPTAGALHNTIGSRRGLDYLMQSSLASPKTSTFASGTQARRLLTRREASPFHPSRPQYLGPYR